MNELFSNLKIFSNQTKRFNDHKQFFESTGFEMKYNGREEAVGAINVNEEALISVLVHFRNFYMNSSKIYFAGIAESILKEISLKEYWEKTSEFLSAWETLLNPDLNNLGGLSIQINSNKLSAKKNFDLWLNENYFHVDQQNPGSNKGLDGIKSQHIFEKISQFQMIDLLRRLCRLVMAFDVQVVQKVLQKE